MTALRRLAAFAAELDLGDRLMFLGIALLGLGFGLLVAPGAGLIAAGVPMLALGAYVSRNSASRQSTALPEHPADAATALPEHPADAAWDPGR